MLNRYFISCFVFLFFETSVDQASLSSGTTCICWRSLSEQCHCRSGQCLIRWSLLVKVYVCLGGHSSLLYVGLGNRSISMSVYVGICQSMSVYVSLCGSTSVFVGLCRSTSVFVSLGNRSSSVYGGLGDRSSSVYGGLGNRSSSVYDSLGNLCLSRQLVFFRL